MLNTSTEVLDEKEVINGEITMKATPPPRETGICVGNPSLIKVLMYHRIVDDERLSRANWTCVHVKDFRRQLAWLNRWGFTPVSFEDYTLFLEGQLNLPRRPVIITFDDGYLDTYDLAFPILQEYGMKAVVFVLGDRNIRTNYWDLALGYKESPLLDEDQILELQSAGFEIGAHSITHAKLSLLPEDRAWNEIALSKSQLELTLKKPLTTFCYPYGMVNHRVKALVAQAGFRLACSVDTGPPTFGTDHFEIRRLVVSSATGLVGFSVRMLTPYEYYDWSRWKLGSAIHDLNGGKRNGASAVPRQKWDPLSAAGNQ